MQLFGAGLTVCIDCCNKQRRDGHSCGLTLSASNVRDNDNWQSGLFGTVSFTEINLNTMTSAFHKVAER